MLRQYFSVYDFFGKNTKFWFAKYTLNKSKMVRSSRPEMFSKKVFIEIY